MASSLRLCCRLLSTPFYGVRYLSTTTSRFRGDLPLSKAMEFFNNNGVQPLSVPGHGLPIDSDPFEDNWQMKGAFRHGINDHFSHQRLTVREIAMLRFMDAITDKPDWSKKVHDDVIVQRWKEEALHHPDGLIDGTTFTWLIAELRGKAEELKETGIVKALDTESRVLKSDQLIEGSLRDSLRSAVEVVGRNKEKDWHPKSNDQVLNLVHPSLYPLVLGRTRVLENGVTSLDDTFSTEAITVGTNHAQTVEEERPGRGYISEIKNAGLWSTKYQWLPSDIEFVGKSGTDIRIKSYVNNLHPLQHRDMYGMLEKFISKSIPMWNMILFREYDGRTPKRINTHEAEFDPPHPANQDWPGLWDEDNAKNEAMVKKVEEYLQQPNNSIWGPSDEDDGYNTIPADWKERLVNRPDYWKDEWSPYSIVENKWFRCRKLVHPSPVSTYAKRGETEIVELEKEFRDRGLQVIIKLSSVKLTPEIPKYEGGSWHLEGMQNEHIVATSIYYYDVDNITPSRIRFRQNADLDGMSISYEQDDHMPLCKVFGVESDQLRDEPAVQEIGSVETREGRIIAFPNTLHHCVEPFELVDKSRPGHRRFLVLWLVDPHFRIMSTANVPPQQKEWWDDAGVSPVNKADGSVVQDLMTLEEAKKYRLELMDERTKFADTVEGNIDTYNFCEH